MPKTTSAPASAAPGIRMYSMVAPWRWRNPGSAAGAIVAASAGSATSDVTKSLQSRLMSRRRADHALDQIVHLLELGVLLAALGARGDDGLALVVHQRALEDRKTLGQERGLDLVGVLAGLFAHCRTIGRDLDDLFLQTAAIEVRDAFARRDHLEEFRIERFPIPLRAGEIGLRRERRLVDVLAAPHGAAAGALFHPRVRAVDVAGQDVNALVDQAVGGFGFLDRHRPVAGEDHLRGGLRVGELGP